MKRVLARRLVTSIITFFVTISIVFIFAHLSGDPLAELEDDPRVTPDVIAAMKAAFGLNKPLYMQYLDFIWSVLHGNLGYSLQYLRPVEDIIKERFPYTLALLVPSITLSNYLAYKAGVETGWRRGSKFDLSFMTVSMFMRSVPYFWLAIIFLYVFSVKLGWTPIFGAITPGISFANTWAWLKDYLWHYILPFTVLVFRETLAMLLYVRNTLIEVLREDYITTAKAKGLDEAYVKYRYAARNALLPMITILGMRYAFLIDGAVLTETVFAYPGMGRTVFEAIVNRDFWLLQGAVVLLSASVIIVNFIIDIIYLYLDPRVRYR